MNKMLMVGTGVGTTPILGGKGTKSFNQLVKALFANGEKGFAYDPNDLSTMFQDAAGTIPVTDAGQPVGLMLDKSKGLELGAELFTGFNTSILSSRSSDTAPTLITSTGASGAFGVGRAGILFSNKTYKIEVAWSGNTNNAIITMQVGGSYVSLGTGVLGKKVAIVPVTTSGSFAIYKPSSAIGQTFSVDSVSIKEIKGNHAYQTTSAARPILRKNAVTGANYLEFDGSDDFLQTNNIDFTATDKVSLFAGVRKLSDANAAILCELSGDINTNNGCFYLAAPLNVTTKGFALNAKGTIAGAAVTTLNNIAPASAVLTGYADLRSTELKLRLTGRVNTAGASLGFGNYGNHPLYIGRRAGNTLPFNGHIYSLIGVGRITTDGETAAIEKELAKRVGVTLNV